MFLLFSFFRKRLFTIFRQETLVMRRANTKKISFVLFVFSLYVRLTLSLRNTLWIFSRNLLFNLWYDKRPWSSASNNRQFSHFSNILSVNMCNLKWDNLQNFNLDSKLIWCMHKKFIKKWHIYVFHLLFRTQIRLKTFLLL